MRPDGILIYLQRGSPPVGEGANLAFFLPSLIIYVPGDFWHLASFTFLPRVDLNV